MLDFPCFVQVVADHVMAFELAMLQDFHAIVLPHRSADKRFSTDAFAEIVKTIRGFTASLIYTIDADKDGQACRGHSTVRTSGTGGFDFEELVHAIASIVDEPPSAEVLGQAIATVSTDPQDACYVQAVELPKPHSATRVALSSPQKASNAAAPRRKRSRKEAEGPTSTSSASSSSVPSHHTHSHAHGHAQPQGHHSQDPRHFQGHQHAESQAQASYQQYWASWQQHFYQQSQSQQQAPPPHNPQQQHAAWARSHSSQSSHPSTHHSTQSTHPTLPPATSFSHPPHPHAFEYPHPYPYHYTDAPVHTNHQGQGYHAAPTARAAHNTSVPAHHRRSDSTTEEACSITSTSTSDSTYATEEEECGLRLSTTSTESAADLDLDGFDDMLFCISNSPVPF